MALRRLRWCGVAGSVLLAIGGFLAGARPGPAPQRQAEALWGTGAGFRIGLAAFMIGLVLLGWAWVRIGQQLHAGGPGEPGRWRWVLATGGLWAAPLLLAPPLGSRDIYAYACQGAVWLDGNHPYQVGAAAGGCVWQEAVPALWQQTTTPYGPAALLISAAAVALARLFATGPDPQLLVTIAGLRLAAVTGGLLIAGYGRRLARVCGVEPATAAWLGLVTPLVALHVVSGAHNDAVVAGLIVASLALAAGRRPGRPPAEPHRQRPGGAALGSAGAGLLLGLAVAVKVTALAAFPFVVLLAAGSGRAAGAESRPGPPVLGRGAVVAAATGAGFLGVTLLTGLGFGWVAALTDTGSLVQWSALPTGLGMAVGYVLRGLGVPGGYDVAVAVARSLGFLGLAVLAAAMLVRAWRRRAEPRQVVLAAGVVLAAVVVLGPVLYPWYAVTPLAVLALAVLAPRHRRWLVVATLVLCLLVLPSGLGVPVLTKGPGAVAVAVAVVVWLRWWVRRRRRPQPSGPPLPVR